MAEQQDKPDDQPDTESPSVTPPDAVADPAPAPPAAQKTPASPAKKAPAKKAPAKKAPAKAVKKAPAKKAPAKKAPAKKAPPKEQPAIPGLSVAPDVTTAAKEAAAQAKSTIATADNPVSGPPPAPLATPGSSRLPLLAAVAVSVLAVLLVVMSRRRSEPEAE